MADIQKCCILCKKLVFDAGREDYSELTPGDSWSCSCKALHFYMSGTSVTEREYRNNLMKAETCQDFEIQEGKS